MSVSEDQHIEFIITKIDILLDEFKDLHIRDALDIIVGEHLTEPERKTYLTYFFNLHKGYSKYKHVNLMIDYHKNVERLAINGNSEPNTEALDELEREISDIEKMNQAEMLKLRTFFFKIITTVLVLGIVAYFFLLLSVSGDMSELILGLAKLV